MPLRVKKTGCSPSSLLLEGIFVLRGSTQSREAYRFYRQNPLLLKLRKIHGFDELSESDFQMVAHTFHQRSFPENCPILEQNHDVRHIGLIVEGVAQMVIRHQNSPKQFIGRLNPGDFFFDPSVFFGHPAIASVISLEPLVCLVQQSNDFLDMLVAHASLKDYFYHLALHQTMQNCQVIFECPSPCDVGVGEPEHIPQNIKKAMLFIDQFYTEPLTLDTLSKKSGMSRFHFSRIFKKVTGYSFKAYLNRKRIAAAKKLMCEQAMNVSEACFRVGYNDVSYFSRTFKAIEGVPPSMFRKNLTEK